MLILALLPRVAGAESVRLIYVRPAGMAGCPDGGEVRDAVAARLGYDPFRDDGQAARTVEATISRRGRALAGTIRLYDAEGRLQGERRLSSESGDCAELASAIELATSLALDPVRFASPATAVTHPLRPLPERVEQGADLTSHHPAPSTASLYLSPARAAPVLRARREPARATAGATWVYVSAGGFLGDDLGLSLELGARRRSWSLGVEARVAASRAFEVPGGGEAEIAVASGSLAACRSGGALVICALVGVERVRGEARGFPGARAASALPAAVGLRMAWELPLVHELALRPFVDGRLLLDDVSVEARGAPIWSAPRLSFHLGAALTLRFR